MITKYDVYYNHVHEELAVIRDREGFTGNGADSRAFGFWYLEKVSGLSTNEINEMLIDGSRDNGVDAFYYDEETHVVNLYQFKLPQQKNINGEIDESSIIKIYSSITDLMDSRFSSNQENVGFKNLIDLFSTEPIFKIKVVFVGYNKGIVSQSSLDVIARNEQKIKDIGVEVQSEIVNSEKIINIYDRDHRNNSLTVTFSYNNLKASNSISDGPAGKAIESWVGNVSGNSLLESLDSNLSNIFDENIRLYENNSKINDGIKMTARHNDQAKMFYFYNNGITMICDEALNSPGNNTIQLTGVSIVNGAQTVSSLAELYENDQLNKDVSILIRIIKISDYEQRSKITEYLNSQTPIKDSYFIANNSKIRQLQTDLYELEYYLERQINEYQYKNKYQDMSNYKDYHILPVADAIQHYVGGFVNNKASQAKSGKSTLFDQNSIDENILNITADKVVKSDKLYSKIADVITKYRKNRRNSDNHEFSEFLEIDTGEYNSDLFAFLNTGDILMLNAVINMQEKFDDMLDQDAIRASAILIKEIIEADEDFNSKAPATLTKSATLFKAVQQAISSPEVELAEPTK